MLGGADVLSQLRMSIQHESLHDAKEAGPPALEALLGRVPPHLARLGISDQNKDPTSHDEALMLARCFFGVEVMAVDICTPMTPSGPR